MAVIDEPGLDRELLADVVERALAEDVGSGDLTTDAIVPAGERWRARLLLEQPGVVCGRSRRRGGVPGARPRCAGAFARRPRARASTTCPLPVAELEGPARAILTGERVALNLFARMCGIATSDAPLRRPRRGHRRDDPRHAQDHARPARAREVRGALRRRHEPPHGPRRRDPDQGQPRAHRGRHRARPRCRYAPPAPTAPSRSRPTRSSRSSRPCGPAPSGSCSTTCRPPRLREPSSSCTAVRCSRHRAASTEDSVRAYAETGVDFISIGALTHGARSLHVSLEVT